MPMYKDKAILLVLRTELEKVFDLPGVGDVEFSEHVEFCSNALVARRVDKDTPIGQTYPYRTVTLEALVDLLDLPEMAEILAFSEQALSRQNWLAFRVWHPYLPQSVEGQQLEQYTIEEFRRLIQKRRYERGVARVVGQNEGID